MSRLPTLDTDQDVSLLVRQLRWESDGVLSAVLVAPDGRALPAWQPGAHIDVLVGMAGVRQFSLCGDPDDRRCWRIAVLRERSGRGGSEWIHERLRCGERVTVRGPRNHFPLEPAGEYLFLAGGIGITPILPMIRAVHPTGKPWRLLYGGRTRASMAFVDELATYGEHVELYPEDECGLIPLHRLDPGADSLVYACGPEGLLTVCESQADRWAPDCLHVERFLPRSRDDADSTPFEVRLDRAKVTLQVPPGVSILSVLREEGFSALSSCEEGVCGTCEVRVLDGEIDHRDDVLSKSERSANNCMMVCVSRARGPYLVLDV